LNLILRLGFSKMSPKNNFFVRQFLHPAGGEAAPLNQFSHHEVLKDNLCYE
jgi:hypothetical protein